MTPNDAPATATPALEARGATVAYGERTVLDGLDVALPAGRVTAIVGANACGKSTLLRALARIVPLRAGEVRLAGEDVSALAPRALARRLGFLPQSPVPPEGLSVRELVARGRFPHLRLGRRPSAEDRERVAWALAATATEELAERPLEALSGGQRQRAWIAMALAQDTEILLLDEPTTYLDLAHQLDVLELLRDLNRDQGRTVVMVLHDLNQAARYADHLVAMADGAVVAAGDPAATVDAGLVERVLGVRVRIVPDPVTGTPMAIPLGRSAAA
ncbi:ABC transporter ATP-binding protein [Patulibacter defluvii]|uniref:ABC transporter ATP-binding protein n=1 Tax=Patulibacter defluvii TaxID=3095358 RepID=UPI002A761E05|nr:ABC transporter ATP-binding protein [Patulibacter sp. DM4]